MNPVEAAVKFGIAGVAGTAGALTGITASIAWPASNIGGYIVAARILGGGAATGAKVAALGGPAIVAGLASLGVGAGLAVLAFSIAKALEKR